MPCAKVGSGRLSEHAATNRASLRMLLITSRGDSLIFADVDEHSENLKSTNKPSLEKETLSSAH